MACMKSNLVNNSYSACMCLHITCIIPFYTGNETTQAQTQAYKKGNTSFSFTYTCYYNNHNWFLFHTSLHKFLD